MPRDDGGRLLVLKIGGSLVSDKRRDGHLDHDAVAGFAAQVADLAGTAPGRVVLVSGGGSIGHGAVRGLDPDDPWAALPLTGANAGLRWAWTAALVAAGARAFPVQFAAIATLSGDGTPELSGDALGGLLAAGALPVLSGDCLPGASGSLVVVGSDQVLPSMTTLRPDPSTVRVVALTDVDGVLGDGGVIPEIDPDAPGPAFEAVRASPVWDTTGGMLGKLGALVECARRGSECFVLRGAPGARSLRHLVLDEDRWPSVVRRTRIGGRPRDGA